MNKVRPIKGATIELSEHMKNSIAATINTIVMMRVIIGMLWRLNSKIVHYWRINPGFSGIFIVI